MAKLIVRSPFGDSEFEIADGETTIGRSAEANLTVKDSSLSRKHCAVFSRDGAFFAEDLGSRNGTLLNGEAISGEVPLAHNNVLSIGETILVLDDDSSPVKVPKSAGIDRSKPYIEDLQSDGAVYSLARNEVTFGRKKSCDVVLSGDGLSNEHFRIAVEKGTYFLADLGSTNGTLVNNEKTTGKTALKNGDRIGAGTVRLSFVDPGAVGTATQTVRRFFVEKEISVKSKQDKINYAAGLIYAAVLLVAAIIVVAGVLVLRKGTDGVRKVNPPPSAEYFTSFEGPGDLSGEHGWAPVGAGDVVILDGENRYSGETGLRLEKAPTAIDTRVVEAVYRKGFSVRAGDTWRLKSQVKTEGAASGGAGLKIYWYMSKDDDVHLCSTAGDYSAPGEFTLLEWDFLVPPEARFARPALFLAGSGGKATFDDFAAFDQSGVDPEKLDEKIFPHRDMNLYLNGRGVFSFYTAAGPYIVDGYVYARAAGQGGATSSSLLGARSPGGVKLLGPGAFPALSASVYAKLGLDGNFTIFFPLKAGAADLELSELGIVYFLAVSKDVFSEELLRVPRKKEFYLPIAAKGRSNPEKAFVSLSEDMWFRVEPASGGVLVYNYFKDRKLSAGQKTEFSISVKRITNSIAREIERYRKELEEKYDPEFVLTAIPNDWKSKLSCDFARAYEISEEITRKYSYNAGEYAAAKTRMADILKTARELKLIAVELEVDAGQFNLVSDYTEAMKYFEFLDVQFGPLDEETGFSEILRDVGGRLKALRTSLVQLENSLDDEDAENLHDKAVRYMERGKYSVALLLCREIELRYPGNTKWVEKARKLGEKIDEKIGDDSK